MKSIDNIEDCFKKIKNKYYSKYQSNHKKNFGNIKKEFLFEISKSLNKLHNKNYSVYEWRLLVGPWLNIALNIYFYYNFFAKYFSKNFKNKISSINLNNFYPPIDYTEFFEIINIKSYQIFFFKKLILNSFNNNIKNKNTFKFNLSLKNFFYLKIINIISSKNTTFLIRSRFKIKHILLLFLKSHLKILPLSDLTQTFKATGVNYNKEKRSEFLNFFNKKNLTIAKFIIDIMPSSYLESFENYEKIGKKILKQPKKIYTDTAHLDDDLTKNLMVNWSFNNNSKILIGQHGGNHRIHDQYVTNYNDDYETCSKYFVWGKPLKNKEIRLSSVRLYNLKKEKNYQENIKYNLCYVFEAIRKNQFQGDFKRNDDYLRSLDTKKKFFKKLKKNFIVKSYYEKNRYKEQLNDKELSNLLNISLNKFKDSKKVIFESNIIILDYISTMIFELISLNIPFILILDKSNEYLSNFGKEFIKELKKLNLFFNNPSEAAKFVNNLPHGKSWWFEKKKQERILHMSLNIILMIGVKI